MLMMNRPNTLVIFLLLNLLLGACGDSEEVIIDPIEEEVESPAAPVNPIEARFMPPENRVLVFVGQDNLSVGGNDASRARVPGDQLWNDGYVDHFSQNLGIPAGITHYIYMVEDKNNAFGRYFEEGINEGLNVVSNWAAGDMCLRCYLDNAGSKLENAVVHLSISMEFNSEDVVASGASDDLIEELGDFLIEFSDFPFLIRIGYEFDGPWNGYDATNYKASFIRIVDQLNARGIENYATVMASSSMFVEQSVWESYYPGDDYVDWLGYSFFDPSHSSNAPALTFARERGKPIFIAEGTPWIGTRMATDDGASIWASWFQPLFQHIESNTDVIKAVSYINAEWLSQPMWENSFHFAIDTRIQLNTVVTERWLEKMNESLYVHDTTGVYNLIGF